MPNKDQKCGLIFRTALLAGEIMLRNGAETYRVEDTINRILAVAELEIIESYVTPTGIFVTLDHPDRDSKTIIKRVQQRTIHMGRIEQVNSVSRAIVNKTLTIQEAFNKLLVIRDYPPYSGKLRLAAYTIVSGCFAVVFGGTLGDFIAASIAGLLLGILYSQLNKTALIPYLKDIISSAFVAAIAIMFTNYLHLSQDLDIVIIGSIMPMVPGLAITNAIRDTIEGDLVSGVSRSAEAFFIAVSIAVGVGFSLKTFM